MNFSIHIFVPPTSIKWGGVGGTLHDCRTDLGLVIMTREWRQSRSDSDLLTITARHVPAVHYYITSTLLYNIVLVTP